MYARSRIKTNGLPPADDDLGGGDGYGSGGVSEYSEIALVVDKPERPISNVPDYIKCFDKNSGAKITIFVDEPAPGTGQSHDKSNVGHAFISIDQQVSNQMVTRTLGFYPQGWVSPINPSSGGVFGDDSDREYDVQLTLDITAAQLNEILNYISSGINSYNLNNFNCTNFVIEALSAAGVNLPQTTGIWPGGQGLNPGNLGQDIMNLPLPSNYVSRSSGGGRALSNRGNCN